MAHPAGAGRRHHFTYAASGLRDTDLTPSSVLSGHRTGCRTQALFAVDVAFSDAAQINGADAFGAFAAPDGAQTGGNAFANWLFGPDAIRSSQPAEPFGATWKPELGAVATSGDLGFTVGFIYQGATIVSKYFTVWQKQPNGKWLYIAD